MISADLCSNENCDDYEPDDHDGECETCTKWMEQFTRDAMAGCGHRPVKPDTHIGMAGR